MNDLGMVGRKSHWRGTFACRFCHVQVDGDLTLTALQALQAVGVPVISWQGSGESIVFRVPAHQAQQAAEALHAALIEDSLQNE